MIGDLANYYKNPRLRKAKQQYYVIKKRLREELKRKIKEELERRNEEVRRKCQESSI